MRTWRSKSCRKPKEQSEQAHLPRLHAISINPLQIFPSHLCDIGIARVMMRKHNHE